jgi:TetR/AcrR family transcriptional regulator
MATNARKRRPGRPKNPIARDKLLALAQQAFAERGYAGASMNEIAASAGLRKASLFHHFATKQALYLEVLAQLAQQLGEELGRPMPPDLPFLDQLDLLGTRASGFFGEHPTAARLLMRELLDYGPYCEGPGAERVQQALDGLASFLQAGMFEGDIPFQDPHQLALGLATLHLGWFALPNVSGALIEGDIFEKGAAQDRLTAALEQQRYLCGVG